MFNLGMGEITVILLLALIFLGPKKLPELASGLGRLIKEIRKTTSDVKNEIQLDETIRKPFDDLRDAMTLHPDELKRRDGIQKELEEARRRIEAEVHAVTDDLQKTLSEPGSDVPTPPPVLAGPATAESVANVPAAPTGTVPRVDGSPRHETPSYVSPGGPAAAAGPRTRSVSGSIPAAPRTPEDTKRPPARTIADIVRSRPAVAPPTAPTAPRVSPPIATADKTNATQLLSEEDLLPSNATTFPPPPPATPRSTGLNKAPPPPPKTPGEKKT